MEQKIKAMDVANFFVNLGTQLKDDNMTNMKVNKLLYFAQGYCMKRFRKPLFEEDMEAWTYGPVEPGVYRAFKEYRNSAISDVSGEYSDDIFPDEIYELLLDIYNEYGKYTTSYLVDISHKSGSPWKRTGEGIIDKGMIKSYFETEAELPVFHPLYSEEDFIGYRDEEDILVLPKEYVDE